MTSLRNESDSDNETSDSVDSLDYTSDQDDMNQNESFKSLDFNLKSGHTAIIKSKKSNKRVRFKPGNSMVLVYIIPNRDMLGLKSESENSDDDEIDEDNENDGEGNEDDDDNDNDIDTDDDSDSDEADNTDDDDSDEDSTDDDDNEIKDAKHKSKPFTKVLAGKQICRKQFPNLHSNRKSPEQTKMINLDISNLQKVKKFPNKINKKEPPTTGKKIKDAPLIDDKCKHNRLKKKMMHRMQQENKAVRHRQRRSTRIMETKVTVETSSNKHESLTSLPKVENKHDIKPTIVDINGAVGLSGLNPPVNRNKLQPISVKVSKPDKSLMSVNALQRLTSASVTRSPIARVVSKCYESSSNSPQHSFLNYQSFDDTVVNETINRLDPGLMNAKSKRNYAWQIANGTISSQSLRTPCILPFWDSLQSSMTEQNIIKLPT